ncbi:trypco2 family protein [Marichromatium sp. AB31]|uniref:trypco2 family protein n=1 Tax=Marichromatium sp. AB31 TaxID=2483362 RepID=UPI000F3FBCFE|nr:trypco2 family protein [Marichromatium sp. AB31]RNE88499.1 hypothetical protein EBL84_16015 [Marichromatium sp. AB31]
MSQTKKITLAEMLTDLRSELLIARSKGADSELRFELGDVELEVEISATKEGGGGGKVKFWVCDAEAKASASSVQTHRLKLTLKPRHARSEESFEVSDEYDLPR